MSIILIASLVFAILLLLYVGYDHILTLLGVTFVAVNLVALQWVSRLRVDTNIHSKLEDGKVSGVAIAHVQAGFRALLPEALELSLNTLFKAIQQLEQQVTRAELVRCQERERLNNQAIANTLDDFANIFDAQTSNPLKQPLNGEEALLCANGAVSRVLGITINPPANSEDLRRLRGE